MVHVQAAKLERVAVFFLQQVGGLVARGDLLWGALGRGLFAEVGGLVAWSDLFWGTFRRGLFAE